MSLIACAPADRAAGERARIESLERARLERSFSLTAAEMHVVADDTYGLVSTEPGEGGFVTSIYRNGFRGWRWVKEKPGAPEPCLFEAADVSSEEAERLSAMLARSVPRIRSAGSHPCSSLTR